MRTAGRPGLVCVYARSQSRFPARDPAVRPEPVTIIARTPPLPAVRGEGSRRERACVAGEGEAADPQEARPHTPPHRRSASLRSPSSTALSPHAGRGEGASRAGRVAHRPLHGDEGLYLLNVAE